MNKPYPTVGRIVLINIQGADRPAIITAVEDSEHISVTAFPSCKQYDAYDPDFAGPTAPGSVPYEWMPYQKAVAAGEVAPTLHATEVVRASGMTFGQALMSLKQGKKVARAGWNGKGTFLFLVPGSTFTVNRAPLLGIYPAGTEIKYQPHIDMKTAQDTVVPWLASQSDLLDTDWMIFD